MDVPMPTVERGIEDEIRRSAFNGCRRILNKTSVEELRTLLAAVRHLESTSVVSRRRARDTPTPAVHSDTSKVAAEQATPPSVVFADELDEMSPTKVLSLQQSVQTLDTTTESLKPTTTTSSSDVATEKEEDPSEAIGGYLRVWLDTVMGRSLDALTTWALHAFCILLGLLPVSSASTPKKSKTVLYSILSNFHYENLGKRQTGTSKTLLEYAAQDRRALQAITKPNKAAAPSVAVDKAQSKKDENKKKQKAETTVSTKSKKEKERKAEKGEKIAKKAPRVAKKGNTSKAAEDVQESQPDSSAAETDSSDSDVYSEEEADEDELHVAGDGNVYEKRVRSSNTNNNKNNNNTNTNRGSGSADNVASVQQKIAVIAYLDAPITLESLTTKLSAQLGASIALQDVVKVVHTMVTAGRLFLQHGIVYSA